MIKLLYLIKTKNNILERNDNFLLILIYTIKSLFFIIICLIN